MRSLGTKFTFAVNHKYHHQPQPPTRPSTSTSIAHFIEVASCPHHPSLPPHSSITATRYKSYHRPSTTQVYYQPSTTTVCHHHSGSHFRTCAASLACPVHSPIPVREPPRSQPSNSKPLSAEWNHLLQPQDLLLSLGLHAWISQTQASERDRPPEGVPHTHLAEDGVHELLSKLALVKSFEAIAHLMPREPVKQLITKGVNAVLQIAVQCSCLKNHKLVVRRSSSFMKMRILPPMQGTSPIHFC